MRKLYDFVGGVPITGEAIATVTLFAPEPVTVQLRMKELSSVPSVAETAPHDIPAVAPATVTVPESNPPAASRVPVMVPLVPLM